MRFVFLSLLCVLCLITAPAWAAEGKIAKTGDSAWDAFIALQNDWTHQLRDLVAKEKPEFKEIADLSMKWRMAEMRLDTERFQYLQRNFPKSIQRDKGLPAFVTLDWFPEYDRRMGEGKKRYEQYVKVSKELKQAVDTHPQWQALQDYLKEIQKKPEHKERFDKFMEEMHRVQKILAKTAADQMRNQN